MKIFRIILFVLLTLSVIFFALSLDVATFISGGFLGKSSQQFLAIQFLLQIPGFFCYWKLLRKLQNKIILSSAKELSYWVIAFITLLILPGGFALQQNLGYKDFKTNQAKYEQEHCVEKTTLKHSYMIKVCENGTIIANTAAEASEYREENK